METSHTARTEEDPVPDKRRGSRIKRYFTRPGIHPFAEVEWEKRSAVISGEKGETVFEQHDVEIPKLWSQLATNVVVSKYFRGPLGTPQREHSVKQLISRVADTITGWGRKDGYFATEEDAQIFSDELTHLLVEQKLAFNSPVWFNVGVEPHPQCSACFILSVEDKMESILDWYRKEGIIFKGGSGSGVNLSKIRSSKERLGGGGTASGPVSFMRAADASAGVIKSGGKTRRAAKMVVLDADHPDIIEFIQCKADEERKAWALIEAGYDSSIDGAAYNSIFFQNANNSVRVTDDFMRAVIENGPWVTRFITIGETCETFQARDLLRKIAEATWQCGDPGMQFDTTINAWHTCPNTGRINASNPCFTGDTLVLTDKGYVSFRDLMHRVCEGEEFRVATDNTTSGGKGIALTTPECLTVTGYNPIYRLTFSNGMGVRCTKNHRFFTLNRGMVPADELAHEDRIVVSTTSVELAGASYALPVSTRFEDYREKFDSHQPLHLPTHWSEEFAELLGHLIGDGSISGNVVTWTYGSAEEQQELVPRHAALLGTTIGQDEPYTNVARIENGTFQLRASRAPFKRFLEALGVREAKAAYKVVPASLFQAPTPIAAAFLRGLFTADGCIVEQPNGTRYVGLSSRSKELLQGVQILLSVFGIFSRIYVTHTDKGDTFRYTRRDGTEVTYSSQGPSYDLRITGRSLREFHRRINFATSSKIQKLRHIVERTDPYDTDTTVTLVNMEPDGVELTYNLTEPTNHSYIVNGLVVANCSEYMHLDDSACNLASLNLMKFLKDDGGFDTAGFKHAVDISITAQDIIVDNSSYPTAEITANAKAFRELGLGYANLGALLMSFGLPYDSEAGRQYAGAITALMTGQAYLQSARLAEKIGPFSGYAVNREPMLGVIDKHRAYAHKLDPSLVPLDLLSEARKVWDEALTLGRKVGYRNSQATVLAPTGTIAFMMDCDTTGVEPDIALVKYKRLVGGGLLKIVNNTVPRALKRLGYDSKEIQAIVEYIDEHETIEGAPLLRDEHLPVFDCAFKPTRGSRSIHYLGHLRMMGAVQPFLSGAISKTINMPNDATVEDIVEAYLEAWRLGLKAVAIYRDGCKRVQPLATGEKPALSRVEGKTEPQPVAVAEPVPVRRRLPNDRQAICHKFDIAGHEGYIHVGFYEDGTPGEIFIKMAKEGSTISGLMDTIATLTSLALQYGVPLEALVSKFSHVRFEPSGFTKNSEIPYAKSLTDYIFRFLGTRFLPTEQKYEAGLVENNDQRESSRGEEEHAHRPTTTDGARAMLSGSTTASASGTTASITIGFRPSHEDSLRSSQPGMQHTVTTWQSQADAPSCADCGSIMIRNGSCYKCLNCGATSGCS